jgi:hypothetical protein
MCRQVSRLLRTEAERQFAQDRLKHISLGWCFDQELDCPLPEDVQRAFDLNSTQIRGITYTGDFTCKSLLSFSDGGSCVTFKGDLSGMNQANMRTCNQGPQMWLVPLVRDFVQKALGYSDLDAHLRFNVKGVAPMRQYCQIGRLFNDAECPGLTLDPIHQTISFEWKPFLNSFFGDYAYVWHRLRRTKTGREATEVILADDAEPIFNQTFEEDTPQLNDKISDWGYDFGNEYEPLYIEAYVERLRNSHAKAGQPLQLRCARNGSTETHFMQSLAEQIDTHRVMRNTRLLKRFERFYKLVTARHC